MKKLVSLFIVIYYLCSCSSSYLVKYSVTGTEDATIVYLIDQNNIQEDIADTWAKTFYINDGDSIGIAVQNNEDSEIDVRVQFIGRGDWQMYKRVIDKSFVNIKGVIHSTL